MFHSPTTNKHHNFTERKRDTRKMKMDQMIKYPTKPSTLLNSLFMFTVNTATKSLFSLASTSGGGVVGKWGISDHLRFMFTLTTWFTVWVLRLLMDHLPYSFIPSPQYFLTGGRFMSLGSSTSSSTSSDLVSVDDYTYGEPNAATGRALSHMFGMLNDMPATSSKYQFVLAMAEKIVDENARNGHAELQEINRSALSSVFSRTTDLLYQSLQRKHNVKTNAWPLQLLNLLPLGSYVSNSVKGIRSISSFLSSFSNKDDEQRRASEGAEAIQVIKSEKHANELLWITNKLRHCGAIDEALFQWSLASGLASSSLMANPRVQSTILIISAILVREMAKEEIQVPRQVKFRLLLLWLPLFSQTSTGLLYPVLTPMEKAEIEKLMHKVISSLPLSDQEIILTNWLQDFVSSNSDWPNLQKSYEHWCRTSRTLYIESSPPEKLLTY